MNLHQKLKKMLREIRERLHNLNNGGADAMNGSKGSSIV